MSKPLVLITGAGSGIGAATARLFSERGHKVVLVGRRKNVLEEVAQSLKNETLVIPTDLRDEGQIDALCDQVKKNGPDLAILINNAGIYEYRSFIESDRALWNNIYETNLMGPVTLTQKLIPILRKQENASVINIASTAGLTPLAGMTVYSTLKAGLIHLTQSLALEFAKDKIRFNCVCPGIVDTPILGLEKKSEADRTAALEQYAKMHPIGRAGKPEDIANAIYFLASSEASWITGVALPVDGGIALS